MGKSASPASPPARLESLKRSIDTLQRLYAIVLGLAFTESLKRLVLVDPAGNTSISWERFHVAIGIILLAIPYLHGMNRFLDERFLFVSADQQARRHPWAYVLIVFIIFAAESLLFALSSVSVSDPAKATSYTVSSICVSIEFLLWIQALDFIWTFVALLHAPIFGKHKPDWTVAVWCGLSLLSCVILFWLLGSAMPNGHKPVCPLLTLAARLPTQWLMRGIDPHLLSRIFLAFATCRTSFDYLLCRKFYFPL